MIRIKYTKLNLNKRVISLRCPKLKYFNKEARFRSCNLLWVERVRRHNKQIVHWKDSLKHTGNTFIWGGPVGQQRVPYVYISTSLSFISTGIQPTTFSSAILDYPIQHLLNSERWTKICQFYVSVSRVMIVCSWTILLAVGFVIQPCHTFCMLLFENFIACHLHKPLDWNLSFGFS